MSTRRIVLGVVIAAVVAAGIGLYRTFEVCAAESRAALTEPKPFGGTDLDADANYLDAKDVCVAAMQTTAPAGEVISHYERELTRLGWSVRIRSKQEIARDSGCGQGDQHDDQSCPTHAGLAATRDGLCYSVATEHYPRSVPPESKMIYVRVASSRSGASGSREC